MPSHQVATKLLHFLRKSTSSSKGSKIHPPYIVQLSQPVLASSFWGINSENLLPLITTEHSSKETYILLATDAAATAAAAATTATANVATATAIRPNSTTISIALDIAPAIAASMHVLIATHVEHHLRFDLLFLKVSLSR